MVLISTNLKTMQWFNHNLCVGKWYRSQTIRSTKHNIELFFIIVNFYILYKIKISFSIRKRS